MTLWANTNILKVKGFKKPTKNTFLSQTEIGDEIMFRVPIKRVGRGRSGHYAVTVEVFNLTRDTADSCTLNTVDRIFDVLEF
jgi:hypothetical protein